MAQWSEAHLRAATYAAGVALWSWNVHTDAVTMDELAYDLWDVPETEGEITFAMLSANIHPVDLERVGAAFAATRAVPGSYEIDFRIMTRNEIRWISARGQGADADINHGLMFGIFLDVTKRKRAEESHELLAGEMSHRVKNLIQIATSLTHLTSSAVCSKEEMAQELTSRLTALGRAHDVVRNGAAYAAARLPDLIAVLLSPYDEKGATVRLRVAVPNVNIGADASTALALVIHELATNSAKYGALSTPRGTLDLSGEASDDGVAITWVERGGPRVAPPASGLGYGSKLLHRNIEFQLGGSVTYTWSEEGVVVLLKMRKCLLER